MSQCECKFCSYYREYQKMIQHVPEEHRAFFNDLYERAEMTEFELEHAQSVIDGSWPSADEYISSARGKQFPVINIKCETQNNGITGTTSLNVLRVEAEDDGSYTVVTDHWSRDSQS